MKTKSKVIPKRAADQCTFTWSLPKELKAKLTLLADSEGRPLSNYLSWILTPQTETMLKTKGIVITEDLLEQTLQDSAERAFRGIPFTVKKR